MKRQKCVLEGVCRGRVCHRTIIYDTDKYKELKSIIFADGTSMRLSIRKALPYEKVKIRHGYDALIEKCLNQKVNSVNDLK